ACGVEARTVGNDVDVGAAVEWAVDASEPKLLAIAIDPNEIFPPLRTKIEQRRRDLMGQASA
ncbi:MAG TPA: hypothetical protein QF695_15625, partial [Arenicellales bacterium]|nr:hypothetical protein [Arenicellales bacterium]